MDFIFFGTLALIFSTSTASHDISGRIGCMIDPDICLPRQEYCIPDGDLGTCMPNILRDFSQQLLQLRDQFPFDINYGQGPYYTQQDSWKSKNINAKKNSLRESYDVDVVNVVNAVRQFVDVDRLSQRQRSDLINLLAELILLQRNMKKLKYEKSSEDFGQMLLEDYENTMTLPEYDAYGESQTLTEDQLENFLLMSLKPPSKQKHKKTNGDKKLGMATKAKLSSADQALLDFIQGWISTNKNQSQGGDKEHKILHSELENADDTFDDETPSDVDPQELTQVIHTENIDNTPLDIAKQQTNKRLGSLAGAEESAEDHEVVAMKLQDDNEQADQQIKQQLNPQKSRSHNHGNQFEAQHKTEDITIYIIVIVFIGVLLLSVIVVLIWAIIKHIRKRIAVKKLMGNDSSSLSDEDYQELCRQRYATKNAETNISAKQNDSVNGKEPFMAKFYQTQKALNSSPSSTVSTPAYVPPYMTTDSLTRNSSIASLSWSEEPVTATLDISTGHAILSYMEDHLKNRERLDEEWAGICAYEAEDVTMETAMLPSNVRKNRTPDSLPFDQNRVKLNPDFNHLGSDYINASSIIDNDPKHPLYIATQGPLSSTIPDFWQMVWEQGCVAIVMLAPIVEESISQCARYWPDEGSCSYDRYEIHLVSEHIWCEDYLVRSLYLKNTTNGETRTVTQFHFLSWPNNGVPQNTKALLELRRKVTKCYKGQSSPVLVHCNDGVARTGTYILLDLAINRMLKGAKEINLAATLEHIRDQRQGVVRSKDQFEFALNAVADEVNAILKSLTVTQRQ